MKTFRVGVVGMGWVAGAHIHALRHLKGAEVAAVCSRRALDPAELEKRFRIPLKVYTDYRHLLRDRTIDVSPSALPIRCTRPRLSRPPRPAST